ncbi:MAG: CinA family protein, partial [Chloroflexi bacterium]|nr:CinA family protein [Chloroflexota bacterium]
SYSNEAKEKLLNVGHNTLTAHGAVSEQTAREMARGARTLFGSDLALSVTGIAGPGGGSADKPVGLTFVGLAAEGCERVERFVWNEDREGNKRASADAALRMAIEYLEGK